MFVRTMEACVRDDFGKRLDLREVGVLDLDAPTRLALPPDRTEELRRALEAGDAVSYGITIEGGTGIVQVPMAPDTPTRDGAPTLCYLQFVSVHGTFTDAASALALLLITFPGVPRDEAGYTVSSTPHGFAFSRPLNTAGATPRTLVIEVYRAPEGQLILSGMAQKSP